MKVLSAIVMTSLIFLASCSNNNNQVLIEQISTSVYLNNEFIELSTLKDLRALEANLTDPVRQQRTEVWQPISLKLHEKTSKVVEQINLEIDTSSSPQNKSDLTILETKIEDLNKTLSNIEPEIVLTFNKVIKDFGSTKIILINQALNEKNKETKKLLLNTLKNKALLLENKIVGFCKMKTEGGCILRFDKFSALIGQNTNQLKRGEILEISAGVGTYSMAAQAKISFDGIIIPTINGVANYKLKANVPPGKHAIPVNIVYTNENGETVTRKFNIDYTVF